MNPSGIEWCDYTWNPITGCLHECPYCYARRMTARFAGDVRLNKMAKKDYSLVSANAGEDLYVLDTPMLNETGKPLVYPFGFAPTLHRYRMDTPAKLKMGKNIFVGAMADMFGAWIPDSWLDEVFEVCTQHSIHNYLFLTKYPQRYEQYCVPAGENMWYGTTITRENDIGRIIYLPAERRKFVSIEPLMEDIEPQNNYLMFRCIDWVIIGAETGKRKDKTVPQLEWVKKIVLEAERNGIPVFMKDSLLPIVGEENMRRDFPSQLKNSKISPKMKKRLFDICAQCKASLKKSEMITLLARSKRGEQPKQFGFMCKDCFKEFCKKLGLDLPELAELAQSITFGPGDDDG